VAALRAGQLVLLPTETVYGLAADAANPAAVARLFEAKGRPAFNPLIAHVSGVEMARRVARLPPQGVALAERFWPGPLTLVAPAVPGATCDLSRAGLDSVAFRAPAHPLAQAVIEAFGGPLAAPSANRSGRPSPTTFADAMAETGAAAAAALDGGACAVGIESTVLSLLGERPALLRPGAVTRDEIEAITGPLAAAPHDVHRSPGRLSRHYAPRAPVRLEAGAPRPGEAFLAFGGTPAGERVFNLSPAGDLVEAAANLYAMLRTADATEPTAIAVAPIPQTGLGEAINDRLRRAAGFVG
jgi:L-threonylcarbamoyladenylate synthase